MKSIKNLVIAVMDAVANIQGPLMAIAAKIVMCSFPQWQQI